MSTQTITLQSYAPTRMMGVRRSALPLREQIESAIALGAEVAIDFTGVDVTQSFVDELVGVLVARRGPDVMNKVVFKGCNESVRAIIRFVVADRASHFLKRAH